MGYGLGLDFDRLSNPRRGDWRTHTYHEGRVELPGHRRHSVIFWIALGACLVALAVALNIGWLVANWPGGVLVVLGVLAGLILVAGLVLNTVFLGTRDPSQREARRVHQRGHTRTEDSRRFAAAIPADPCNRRDLNADQQQEFYQTMLSDMDRLQGTIEQVLLAGSTRSKRKRQQIPVDLAAVVQDCMGRLQHSYSLRDGALQFHSEFDEGDTPIVLGNRDELVAAISNLIDNSIKYSDEQAEVEIEMSNLGSRVAVRIRDNGIGIDSAELRRVFRRFYRVQGTFRPKGTGLGLYIVQSVAKRHGGRVFGESPGKGRGSTFTIELPLTARA